MRRGTDPYPPREPLPLILPTILAQQVRVAQQQMVDDGQLSIDDLPADIGDETAPEAEDAETGQEANPSGRSSSGVSRGTAMQRLRNRTRRW